MALRKIGDGILLGLGAGITAGIIFAIINQLMVNMMWGIEAETINNKVEIIEHREVIRNGRTIILGSVKNNSDTNLHTLSVKVDLFDKEGLFVEQCSEYIARLHANTQVNFKIKCKACDSNKTVEHTSYKVYPTGF